MQETVVQHVLSALHSVGVTKVFGVPGDYAFPFDSAVCEDPRFSWIGTSNELNAAYAADGYARVQGFSAICTTQGAGELSAINGIAGSYAEHVPVFDIVGMEPTTTRNDPLMMHHTLDRGAYESFYDMVAPVVCARAILTPENCVAEMQRLVATAVYERRPVYIGIPSDCATAPVVVNDDTTRFTAPQSDPIALEEAATAIIDALARSATACMLPGILTARFGLRAAVFALREASRLPFATMLMDKGILDETNPAYLGMYLGHQGNTDAWRFIEGCDCVLAIGVMFTDTTSMGDTVQLEQSKLIEITPHATRIDATLYEQVEMGDLVRVLIERVPAYAGSMGPAPAVAPSVEAPAVEEGAVLTADYLYERWGALLQPGDTVLAEWGTILLEFTQMQLPAGVTLLNDGLWSSIGWATPATFGAALADPGGRVLLFTGDGAHQMTAQEVSQIARQGLKPIIFVLNNSGYLVERLTGHGMQNYYNDLAPWNYEALANALGCTAWMTAQVRTCGELDQAIKEAQTCETGAYIEVIVDESVVTTSSLGAMMAAHV